jgi:sulfur carrier protein
MVKLVMRGREYEVRQGMTLRHALEKIGLNREAVIAVLDGELITDDQILKDGQVIRLVGVISGG